MVDNAVRVFVSSPADVEHERAAVKDIIERLANEYLPYFPLRAILWEEEALTADRTFQAGLTQPEDCDIVLVILWTRLGSPLPQEPYRGMTGTEWEFINAVEASARGGHPEVLVYKKVTPKLVDITDATLAREAMDDRARLEDFFRAHFFYDDNTFRRAFRTFESAAAFRELVESQLRKLLNRRISAERRASAGELTWRGSPFRPDRPFDLSDERVFTGREQEVRDLLQRLELGASSAGGLLLIAGPSGSGKTSLVRAGLLPRLMRPFQFEEIATVRACLIDPLRDGSTPIEAMARQLCADAVLAAPLADFGLGPAELAQLLNSNPGLAARQITSALRAGAPAASAGGGARLLVVLDPLDGILKSDGGAGLEAFAGAVRALAETDHAWVLGVLGSDALPSLDRLPALHPLLDQLGWIELEPMPAARIRQVIEIPARIAGIDLDSDAAQGRGLVERLETEASRLRLWPPPLQAVLENAYQQALSAGTVNDADEIRLADGDDRTIGGMTKHVLERAAAVWDALDDAARGALPTLCRALVGLDSASSARATLRAGSLTVLRRDPACARLVDRLIEARLVVAEGYRDPTLSIRCDPPDYRIRAELEAILRQTRNDWRRRWQQFRGHTPKAAVETQPKALALPEDALEPSTAGREAAPGEAQGTEQKHQAWRDYRAVASFSHPALVSGWAPVRHWLGVPENRRLIALRFQLDRQAQMWKRTRCNAEYLMREAGCASADELTAAYANELEPLEQAFIEQSKANLALLRRRGALVRVVGAVLAALVLLSSITAGLAYRASSQAKVNLNHSKLKEADLFIARGNTPQAVSLALAAGTDLPQRAVQTLGIAFSSNRLAAMAPSPSPVPDEPRLPGFNDTGDRLAAFLPDQGPTLLRLERDRFLPMLDLDGAGLGLHTLVIGPDDHVFGIAKSGIWALPAGQDQPPTYACGSPAGPIFALDASRRRLAVSNNTTDGFSSLCVVDLDEPGTVVLNKSLGEGSLRGIAFSPDGRQLLTASSVGRSHLIDLETGQIELSLPEDGPLGRPFNNVAFDAKGRRIAIASADERVRLYHSDGRPIAELSSAEIGGQEFKMHRSAVRDVAFAPASDLLVAVDDEGQVVRWKIPPLGEASSSGAVQDSPVDGRPPASCCPTKGFTAQAVVLGTHTLSTGTVETIIPPPETGFDQTLVLTASLDGTARLWGLQTAKPIAVLGHDGAITAAGFNASGRRISTFSTQDETVRLWSVNPISQLAYHLRHPDHVWYVDTADAPRAIAGDRQALLLGTAGWDGGVRVWTYQRSDTGDAPVLWAELNDTGAGTAPVRQVRFAHSGLSLASAHYDGTARIYDLISKAGICKLRAADSDNGQVYNALFSPDDAWVLTTSDDVKAPVRAFSTESCELLDTGAALAHGSSAVEAAVIRARQDGVLIATGDQSGTLRVIDVGADGQWHQRCTAQPGVGAIGDLALSPDARTLGIAGQANHSVLVELDPTVPPGGGQQADGCGTSLKLEGHTGRVYSIAFSPDSEQVITASLDNSARLWGRDGQARAVLVGHQDRIYRADFSPDGRWMLTGSRDGSIRVWKRPSSGGKKLETLSAFLPLEADAGGVANAVFSHDGHYIAGAYWENTAMLWRLWAETETLPEGVRGQWGPDRSRLALVQEAYQFKRDNSAIERQETKAKVDAER